VTSSLLQQAPVRYPIQVQELLLAALLQSVCAWSGQAALRLSLESHGRELDQAGLDVSRTVGWFTALYPLVLELPAPATAEALLRGVKQALRSVPRQGVGYGLLRYLSPDAALRAALQAQPLPELCFNYLGQFTARPGQVGPFRAQWERSGLERSWRDRRPHLLEVTALVSEGELQVQWHYDPRLHSQAEVARLAQAMLDHLERLLAYCLTPTASGFSPADFPLIDLDQEEIDKAFATVEFEGEPR
jgi:microcystin synthetase protein McyA